MASEGEGDVQTFRERGWGPVCWRDTKSALRDARGITEV
jgi:hypothetical protein